VRACWGLDGVIVYRIYIEIRVMILSFLERCSNDLVGNLKPCSLQSLSRHVLTLLALFLVLFEVLFANLFDPLRICILFRTRFYFYIFSFHCRWSSGHFVY
jgi:hypothetical protein